MIETPTSSLGRRVVRAENEAAEVWALPLGVPEVVSFRASMPTDADLAGPDRTTQRAALRLLDRGAARLDRFEIAEWLEGRGAVLNFFSRGPRAGFSGRCLRADLPDVLALAAELLTTPRFDAEEVEKVRRELEGSLRQAATDTAHLAEAALSRHLYAPAHPGFIPDLGQRRADVEALTPEAILQFHRQRVLGGRLLLAVAGDLEGVEVEALLDPFAGWQAGARRHAPPPVGTAPGERADVPVPDKSNYDVRLGQGVPLVRIDADYQPLRVGLYALGGNFSSRLMQEVRDRQGLTYGIRASLQNVEKDQQGHFEVGGGFSPADLERGLDATRAVIAEWHEAGLEEDELARVQETLVGTYDVGLSATGGLAATLLARAEQGFTPAYLDTYRDEIRAVTTAQVQRAVQRLLDPEKLLVVTSGPPR